MRILKPLHVLLTGSAKTDYHLVCCLYTNVKNILANTTLLVHPQTDAPMCFVTDASDTAVGAAVLQQRIESVWSPLAYFSHKLKPAETRYSTFDRELLATYLAIKHFQHFLEGWQFSVITDHKPLTFALTSPSRLYFTVYFGHPVYQGCIQCCS